MNLGVVRSLPRPPQKFLWLMVVASHCAASRRGLVASSFWAAAVDYTRDKLKKQSPMQASLRRYWLSCGSRQNTHVKERQLAMIDG